MTIAAPAAIARRLRSAQIRLLKCVVVTITGNAARDVAQHQVHNPVALVIGKHELFGEVREDTEAFRARIDHEVRGAALTVQIEFTAFGEHCRHHGKDPAHRRFGGRGHRTSLRCRAGLRWRGHFPSPKARSFGGVLTQWSGIRWRTIDPA